MEYCLWCGKEITGEFAQDFEYFYHPVCKEEAMEIINRDINDRKLIRAHGISLKLHTKSSRVLGSVFKDLPDLPLRNYWEDRLYGARKITRNRGE